MDWELTKLIDIKRQEYANNRDIVSHCQRFHLRLAYIRNVKFIKVMHFKQKFVTAVCALFLLKLKWPKSKNFYEL